MALRNYTIRSVRSQVYVRRAAAGRMINGEHEGFELDNNLRCQSVSSVVGPKVAVADFDFVPRSNAQVAIESALTSYGPDDQVRVVAWPHDEELSNSPADGFRIFEGVLSRRGFAYQRASEEVTLTALALPTVLDNDGTMHLITGRWIAQLKPPTEPEEEPDFEHFVVESPGMPAAFNFDGRPNMHPKATILRTLDGVELSAPVFTHDDDPNGQYWTAAKAIASIFLRWWEGTDETPLPNTITISNSTLAALIGGDNYEYNGRFEGLDRQLPEVNVHGLGPLDAIARVCETVGFAFALEPRTELKGPPYRFRLWKKDTGERKWLDIARRGSSFADGEALAEANTVSAMSGMVDGFETANEIISRGRTFIDARLQLKPLWRPVDVDHTQITAALQEDGETNYHEKHVVNGDSFKNYGHVGRLWGLDCVGGFAGYEESNYTEQQITDLGLDEGEPLPYPHDPYGVDFVALLELDGGSNDLISRERTALGITEPIRWTKRLRRALPIMSPEARRLGVDYALDVSEDGGKTWSPCDVRFSTARNYLGIMISVPNLAAVNNESLRSGITPAVEDSWWALIQSRKLVFRLYCAIEADHAERFDALRQPTAMSGYLRGQVVVEQFNTLYVMPNGPFNTDPIWVKKVGWGIGPEGSYTTAMADRAKARRDVLEGGRLSAAATCWKLDFERFRLGDRIVGVRGRELSFGVNAGNDVRHPDLVGLKYVLHPENQQSVQLTLEDAAMINGEVGRGRMPP